MKTIMKLRILLPLLLLLGCQPSSRKDAISRQLQDYPESRVQDIYKNFCQDNLGPGHLIPDADAARNYLNAELASFRNELDSLGYTSPAKAYCPVGDLGNYVRVDLSVVLDSLVSEELLLHAFIRSANEGKKITQEEWAAKWRGIAEIIRKDFGTIPGAAEDLVRLDSLIEEGHYIVHHSREYNAAYHPHYRIVSKDIFDTELKPLIDRN